MQRSLYLIGPLLILVAIALACGDDGGDGENGVTPTADASPTTETSPAAVATPAATPTDTPASTVTGTPELRRATPLVEASAFLELTADRNPTAENCNYDEDSGLLDCTSAGVGMIQLDPPVRGTGVECEAVTLGGELIGIICTSTEPLFATIYLLAD